MKNRRDQDSAAGRRRMPSGLLALAACLCAPLPAPAQVYKWTDAQGTVHYSDTPPPAQAAKRATQLKPASAGEAASSLPYELARAAKLHPVTLYTTADCGGCDQGRALLRARGIPYTEKTIASDEDKEQLRRLTGKLELPLLVVGGRKLAGFQDAAWQDALNAAAYPRRTQLPPGYQYAGPEPAAPASVPTPPSRARAAPAPSEAAAQAAEQQPRRPSAREATPAPKPPDGNAPPGFQF